MLLSDARRYAPHPGAEQTPAHEVESFDSVSCVITAVVTISFGDTQSVTITGGENIISDIKPAVKKGELRFDFKLAFYPDPVAIDIVMAGPLKRVSVVGPVVLKVLDIDQADLEVYSHSYESVTLAGKVDNLRLKNEGRASIDASRLVAKKLKIAGDGAVSAKAKKEVVIKTEGDDPIRVKGSPKKITVKNTGGADIQVR